MDKILDHIAKLARTRTDPTSRWSVTLLYTVDLTGEEISISGLFTEGDSISQRYGGAIQATFLVMKSSLPSEIQKRDLVATATAIYQVENWEFPGFDDVRLLLRLKQRL